MTHKFITAFEMVRVLRHCYHLDLQTIGSICVCLADKGRAIEITKSRRTRTDYKVEVSLYPDSETPIQLVITEI